MNIVITLDSVKQRLAKVEQAALRFQRAPNTHDDAREIQRSKLFKDALSVLSDSYAISNETNEKETTALSYQLKQLLFAIEHFER